MAGQMENPGALAGATGADLGFQRAPEDYRDSLCRATSAFAHDRHQRACRMLGYALTLNEPSVWGRAALILSHRLTSTEAASIAFAALSTLEPEAREAVFDAAMWGAA